MQRGLAPVMVVIGVLLLLVGGLGGYILATKPQGPVYMSPLPAPTNSSSEETTEWKTYTNNEQGFSFKYPASWYLGQSSLNICLGSHQSYVDFYCNDNTSVELPKEGFKTTFVGLDKSFTVPQGTSEKTALKMESGRGALPLIKEEYLTINNLPAYRALRQLKQGQSAYGADGTPSEITRTDVEYTFIKENQLYRLWFELDSNNPEESIKLFDQVAQTFKFTQ